MSLVSQRNLHCLFIFRKKRSEKAWERWSRGTWPLSSVLLRKRWAESWGRRRCRSRAWTGVTRSSTKGSSKSPWRPSPGTTGLASMSPWSASWRTTSTRPSPRAPARAGKAAVTARSTMLPPLTAPPRPSVVLLCCHRQRWHAGPAGAGRYLCCCCRVGTCACARSAAGLSTSAPSAARRRPPAYQSSCLDRLPQPSEPAPLLLPVWSLHFYSYSCFAWADDAQKKGFSDNGAEEVSFCGFIRQAEGFYRQRQGLRFYSHVWDH